MLSRVTEGRGDLSVGSEVTSPLLCRAGPSLRVILPSLYGSGRLSSEAAKPAALPGIVRPRASSMPVTRRYSFDPPVSMRDSEAAP